MTIRSITTAIAMTTLALSATAPLSAQQPDTSRAPTGAFIGRIISSLDRTPVRSVDIRLGFVDSSRLVRTARGVDSLEAFIDSSRSRVGASDSAGKFAIRRLAAGHYFFTLRRIGFAPLQGGLSVADGDIGGTLTMQVTSTLLSRVTITESSVDKVKQRLDWQGFTTRYHEGIGGTWIQRPEILRRQAQNVAEILDAYGIHGPGDYQIDKMPTDYDALRDYPAELVIGIEIYRNNRPVEFNMTRNVRSSFQPGGQSALMQPLVLIWTYIP
jgi:hypothetical protein